MSKSRATSRKKWTHGLSKTWTWILLAAIAAGYGLYLNLSGGSGTLALDGLDADSIARGGDLFAIHCASCHGSQAGGEDSVRPRGGVRANGAFLAPALNGTGHAWHHPPDALFGIVKDGSPAAGSQMRGWAEKMSDGEIAMVLAYIQSLWPQELLQRYRKSFPIREAG